MVNYQKLYTLMFNAATDSLRAMEQQNYGVAMELLKAAQLAAEEQYLEDTDADSESENKKAHPFG